MSTQDNGGPAFPTPVRMTANTPPGMTLRDYFAAKAMAGVLSSCGEVLTEREHAEIVAQAAYFMADAMLKARAASSNTGEAPT